MQDQSILIDEGAEGGQGGGTEWWLPPWYARAVRPFDKAKPFVLLLLSK